MTPSPPTTFFTVTAANGSSSISSSSSSSTNASSTSSSSSGPSSSATPPPFGPLAHARFGLGDLTGGLGDLLWGDLTSDTTPLASPVAGPTAATPTAATPSSDAAVVPWTGKATGRTNSTQAAAASTAAVSLSTATNIASTSTSTSTSTPSASPLLPSPPLSTTGHEALIAYASSAPGTSTGTNENASTGTSESGGLRPGDLAGITIAAHVVLTVFMGLGLWHYRRKYRQLRDKERQRQRRRELASSTGYDGDDKDMIWSHKTVSSSTILEMKRLRAGGGGGGRTASKGSLSALELLEPGTSPAMMSGGGGGRWPDHGGAAVPLTPNESPIIRPPSPLRLKGSDLRRKKPNLNQSNNDCHHAAATPDAIHKNNHLFQGDDDDDDDASSSCYHYSDVVDDRPASFGPARTPLLHLPNLSFHTLDLMADRPAFKEVKRYSVASPILTPVPADDEEGIVGGWPAAMDGRRGSGRFPLVASVAGSVVGRKSDEGEEEEEDGRGGGSQDNDAGAPARAKAQGQGQATRGVSRTVKEGPKSPKSPPKILLYPKPYKGW